MEIGEVIIPALEEVRLVNFNVNTSWVDRTMLYYHFTRSTRPLMASTYKESKELIIFLIVDSCVQ